MPGMRLIDSAGLPTVFGYSVAVVRSVGVDLVGQGSHRVVLPFGRRRAAGSHGERAREGQGGPGKSEKAREGQGGYLYSRNGQQMPDIRIYRLGRA